MDPIIGGALISGGGDFLSNFMGGLFGKSEADKDRKIQRTIFQHQQGLAEGLAGTDIARMLDQLPMRDRLQFLLTARMGMPSQPMKYNTSGAVPGTGSPGINQADLNAQITGYQPGQGGTGNSKVALERLLAMLGYGGSGPYAGKPLLYPKQPKAKPQYAGGGAGYNPYLPGQSKMGALT